MLHHHNTPKLYIAYVPPQHGLPAVISWEIHDRGVIHCLQQEKGFYAEAMRLYLAEHFPSLLIESFANEKPA